LLNGAQNTGDLVHEVQDSRLENDPQTGKGKWGQRTSAEGQTDLLELADGKVVTGIVVKESAKTVLIREADGTQRELALAKIESRTIQKQSMMPEGLVNNLAPEGLADLIAYLQSLTGEGVRIVEVIP
jgi:hypothetical protein